MDAIDRLILSLLKKNGRMPAKQIAEKIHLSVPAAAERVRKLQEQGIIRGFTVRLDREKTGQHLLAYIFVALEKPGQIASFLETVQLQNAVLECHHVAGEYDYLLKAAVSGTGELETLVSGILKKQEGVIRTNTLVVLSTPKEEC